MNFISINQFKKITKGTLAIVLASTFSFSSLVFANENATTQANYETVDLSALQEQLESTQEEAPSIIPGDFFYFAKITLEKIKLAITIDNAKEAELMATYASERLAEAAVLYGEGKEAEALEVIQTAIEYMESSQNVIDEETITEKEITNEQPSQETPEPATDESNNTDDSAVIEVEDNEDNPYAGAQDTLRNNIVALTAAMSHVGNDQARASLQKNIDKTYAKLAKKLAKLEKKYGPDENVSESNNPGTEETVVNTNTPAPITDISEPTNTNIADTAAKNSEAIGKEAVTVTAPPTIPSHTKTEVKSDKEHLKQVRESQHEKGKSVQAQQNNNERKEGNLTKKDNK